MEDKISSLNWIPKHLKIINKVGQLISLEPNIGQLMLHRVIQRQRDAGFPVRIILLKPRQVGWSTWSEAEAFYEINLHKNRTALCVSADTDSTDLVFNMTRLFQDQMPIEAKRKTNASNRKEIVYSSPHRSKFLTQTAGKDVLGRGGTVHFFHSSELAFWPKAKTGLAAVLQMVPNTLDTTVIIESTANGVGGAFYDMFQQAVDRIETDKDDLSGYLPVFFPWYDFPEYRVTTPKGFSMSEDERGLAKEFGLLPEQIYYRRLKIQEFSGDESLFRQEYPATHLEAFQASGNPVFTQSIIKYQKANQNKHPRTLVFVKGDVDDVNRTFNCWHIAHMPERDHQYCIGADTMEGRLSDVQDPKSTLDCDAAAIYDRTANRFVGVYVGRGSQTDLGKQCLWAAQMYNDAWFAPEIPNSMTMLNMFKESGYQNIYNRQVHDERLATEDSENLGWRTTLVTRKWLVNDFVAAMRDAKTTVVLPQLIGQMETFVYNKDGKPIHMSGKHDDVLFAAMIALQVHLRCPLDTAVMLGSHTSDEVKPNMKDDSLAMRNAIDTGVTEDEEEELDYTD